ncbi:MAG: hypothetical protein ACI8X5_000103 [Planctomycetota bacterium]|jgi:hypothetical protein
MLLGALVLGTFASCDNPACLFGSNGCQILANGGANAVSATFPEIGEWVEPVAPSIERIFPEGFAHPQSPVVIVFNESISPGTIAGAFEVRATAGGGTGSQVSSVLVGDGRVLVLLPSGLVPGLEYEVAYASDASIRDLSGALVAQPDGGVIATFSVDSEPVPEPGVLMTWPLNNATGSSPITEVVTVFDRVINATSVTPASWSVKIDGIDPAFNPPPLPTMVPSGNGGGPTTDTRIYTWTSLDPVTAERVELGVDAMVTIELSTGANTNTHISTFGTEKMPVAFMAPLTNTSTTLPFSIPSMPVIQSEPDDAIGIENLSPTGSRPFMMTVEIPGGILDGDVLEVFMVGTNPPDPNNANAPARISSFREVPLSAGPGPVLLEESDLLLVSTVTPLTAIFDDADIAFAFSLRRGALRTPIWLLDVDLTSEGVQDAFIDTTGPTFLNLLGKEEGDLLLVSDLRELSVSGVAAEEIRTASVVAHLMSGDVDNLVGGELPPLPVFATNGAFIAAPVNIGQVPFGDLVVPVDMVIYDKGLNPSEVISFNYTQRGSSGVGMDISSGNDIDVTVVDAVTLAPIVGANVYRHESVGGVLTATITGVLATDNAGEVAMSPAPGGDTLITVDAAGYDLFTFQGVPTTRLDVLLIPTPVPFGTALNSARTPTNALTSPFLHAFAADSRALLASDKLILSSDTAYNPLLNQTIITFATIGVSLGKAGLVTFLATKDPSSLTNPSAFSAATFLQAFELEFPRTPLGPPPPVDVVSFVTSTLLSDVSINPADIPLGTVEQRLAKPANYALDFPSGTLPTVSVEAFTPGIDGLMTAGMGLAYFNSGNDNWDLRSAYSARIKAGGELATSLAIEDERLLRVELTDPTGNRTGVRQPLSAAMMNDTLTPAGVPLLTAPAANSGGVAFDLVFENVITGSLDTKGLYHAMLVDSGARRWHLWSVDTADGAGSIVAHVPPIGIQGGVGLADGIIICILDAWAWDAFDRNAFMFSDIERRAEQFTSASPKVFSQP